MEQKETKKRSSFMQNVLILMFAQIMVKVLGLVYKFVITNFEGFGDTGLGYYSAGYQIYSLLLALSSIGIPTVVEAATIAADSLDLFIQKVQEEAKSNEFLNQLQEEDKYEMIKEVLTPEDYNFIVTPKEIDDLIENMKDVVARGINFATQK